MAPVEEDAAASGQEAALWLWKSRLPAIVVPVLAGLWRLTPITRTSVAGDRSGCIHIAEIAFLCFSTVGSGYFQLPFSMTWWFVLIAAFVFETPFLLGVATVLSLTVTLGWYGVQVLHPHAIMALWGGGSVAKTGVPVSSWRAWDMLVHAFPAGCMLYMHGPAVTTIAIDSFSLGKLHVAPGNSGTVSATAASAALCMNMLWLWGLGLRSKPLHLWPWNTSLGDSNRVYRIFPAMSLRAWLWAYGSHWLSCALWAAALAFPPQTFLAYSIYFVAGLCKIPFTNAWWINFLIAIVIDADSNGVAFFRAMVVCAAVPVVVGFYATQIVYPHVFVSLVNAWAVRPVQRYAPVWLSTRWLWFSKTLAFTIVARLADFCLHVVPTMTAVWLFRSHVTGSAALASLPANLYYWAAYSAVSGAVNFADTNMVYGIEPNLPNCAWTAVFSVHWIFCGLIYCSSLCFDMLVPLASS